MVIVHTMVIVHIYIYEPCAISTSCSTQRLWGTGHSSWSPSRCQRTSSTSSMQLLSSWRNLPRHSRTWSQKRSQRQSTIWGSSLRQPLWWDIGFSTKQSYNGNWIQFERSLRICMMTNSVWTEFANLNDDKFSLNGVFTSLHDDNTWACNTHTMGFHRSQVNKYSAMARERLELSKALLRASDKAANPKAKAAPKAAASAANSKPRSEK